MQPEEARSQGGDTLITRAGHEGRELGIHVPPVRQEQAGAEPQAVRAVSLSADWLPSSMTTPGLFSEVVALPGRALVNQRAEPCTIFVEELPGEGNCWPGVSTEAVPRLPEIRVILSD